MGITQFAKENAVKSKKKVLHGSWAFAPKGKDGTILPALRNTAVDAATSSDTDNDRDASSTC